MSEHDGMEHDRRYPPKPIGPPNRVVRQGSTAGAIGLVLVVLAGAVIGFLLGGL